MAYDPSICEASMVRYEQCLNAGEFRYSCNGCFRMGFLDGSFVISHATDPSSIIHTIFNGSAVKVCASYQGITFYSASDEILRMDIVYGYERTYFYLSDTSTFNVRQYYSYTMQTLRSYGVNTECIGSVTLPTTITTTHFYQSICDSAIIKPGECLFPWQFKYSCNGCFRMGLIDGNLVISSSADQPRILIFD